MNSTKQDFHQKLLTRDMSNNSFKEPYQTIANMKSEKDLVPENFYKTIKPTDDETMRKIFTFADI